MLAHLGREADTRAAITVAFETTERMQAHAVAAYAIAALGHLELSLGRVTEAAAALEPLVGMTARLGMSEPAVVQWRPDLIEALVRAGRIAEAEQQLAVLEQQAEATGGGWARARRAPLPRAPRAGGRLPRGAPGGAGAPRGAPRCRSRRADAARVRRAPAAGEGARRGARAPAGGAGRRSSGWARPRGRSARRRSCGRPARPRGAGRRRRARA